MSVIQAKIRQIITTILKMIYLNNAATSYPKPDSVVSATIDSLLKIPYEPGRDSKKNELDVLTRCRSKLAELFQIENVTRIILTSGSTSALNMVIQGLNQKQINKHCITSTQEHNSVLRPLNHLTKSHDLKISYISATQLYNLTAFEKCLQKSTLFVVLNHVSNVTGTILPIKEIASWCSGKGLPLVIDASQSAGSIDINVKELPQNIILAFTGHKGLMGPMGTGGFYLGTAIELFEPLMQGGTGIRSDLLYQPKELPLYYEAGTMNLPGFAGLAAGINFVNEIGVKQIGLHKHLLFETLNKLLYKLEEIIFYSPLDRNYAGGIFSFNINGWHPKDLGYVLHESFGIINRSGLHCASLIHQDIGSSPEGTVRLSCSWFNTLAEIEETTKAIKMVLKGH